MVLDSGWRGVLVNASTIVVAASAALFADNCLLCLDCLRFWMNKCSHECLIDGGWLLLRLHFVLLIAYFVSNGVECLTDGGRCFGCASS